jgi:flagellar biosynthesis/type III secretory pathway chaperone
MTSSRANSLDQLLGLLQSALALTRDALAPVLAAKQQALVANELGELLRLAEQEQRLAGQLAALEAERIAATAEVCRAHAINPEEGAELKLSELLTLLPATPERDALAHEAAELQLALVEVAWLNGDNGCLTRNLLDYTAAVIRSVIAGNAKPSYDRDGRVLDGAPERAMLDDRI